MTNVLVCVKCGGSCIRNGIAVRRQRWKCSKCGKGFYTEVEKEGVVNPFKVLMEGKYRKCDMCGVETLNGVLCDGCELVEEWSRDVEWSRNGNSYDGLSYDGLKGSSVVKCSFAMFEGETEGRKLGIDEMFKITVERAEAEGCVGQGELDRDRTLLNNCKRELTGLREQVKIKAFNDMVDNIKASELNEFNGLTDISSLDDCDSEFSELGKSFSFKAKRAELQLALFN